MSLLIALALLAAPPPPPAPAAVVAVQGASRDGGAAWLVECPNCPTGGGGGVSSSVSVLDAGVLNVNAVAVASVPTLNIGDAGVLNVNPHTVNQGTSPWVTSGTATQGMSNDGGYAWHVQIDSVLFVQDAGVLNVNPVAISSAPTLNIADAGVLNVNFPASQAVTGPLTDTQLRASVVPVFVDGGQIAITNFPASQAVTGPLTDTQLRASAVPVSLTSTTVTGSVAVTGPITDTQLRASVVPVYVDGGTVTATQGTNPWTVSGTVAATQSTSPWVENISQFGGTNLSTGTGGSGTGIPRVTIANDSSLAANQSVNLTQVGSATVTTGAGTTASNTQRVVLPTDQNLAVSIVDGGVLMLAQNPVGVSVGLQVAASGALVVTPTAIVNPYPLNPFLPRCNPVRRTNCQP